MPRAGLVGRRDLPDKLIERNGPIADARPRADSRIESGRVARTLNSYCHWVTGTNKNHGSCHWYHCNRYFAKQFARNHISTPLPKMLVTLTILLLILITSKVN